MHRRLARALVATLAAVAVLATGACSPGPADEADGRVRVVASTNVWGDVMTQVGGNLVAVTSLIDNPAADAHSFEVSARA